jgi:hypothetical protein
MKILRTYEVMDKLAKKYSLNEIAGLAVFGVSPGEHVLA